MGPGQHNSFSQKEVLMPIVMFPTHVNCKRPGTKATCACNCIMLDSNQPKLPNTHTHYRGLMKFCKLDFLRLYTYNVLVVIGL